MTFNFKEHIVTISGIIGSLGIIAGAWLAVDSRFANAEEVKGKFAENYIKQQELQANQSKTFHVMQREQKIFFQQLQISSLDDKIFYIEQKPKLTPQDKAMLSRLKDQRRDAVEMAKATMAVPSIDVAKMERR